MTPGTIARRMREALNATRAFRLTGETSADWETLAAAAGLEELDAALDALKADCFAATAGADQLDRWARFLGELPAPGDPEDRRQVLLGRLSQRPGGFTPADFARALPGAGVLGTLQEADGALTVTVDRLLGVTQAQADAALDRLLPAHLPWSRA